MKARIYLLLKLFFLFIVLPGVLYIFEYGFTFTSWDKLFIPLLLSGLTIIILFKANFKRYALFLSGACLVLMISAYILNLSGPFNAVGNFGFSLLLVTIVLYLPQIIKKGHIEKF